MTTARPRVLVVDDDPNFARMVTEVLREKGYDAVGVQDPAGALEATGGDFFSAAVIDLVMPQSDGLELAEQIRARSPETEIVILTGHADVESAIGGIRAGIFDYLRKPSLDIARLERTVGSAVHKAELTRQNRRLLARLEESNRLLRALNEVSARLAQQTHLDRLLEALVDSAKGLLGAEAARAMLLDRHPLGDLIVRSVVPGDEGLLGGRFAAEGGIAMLAATSGQFLRTADAKSHPNYSPRCDHLPTTLPGLMCCSLSRKGVLGILMVAGREAPFSEDDESLFSSLARQGSVAVENARNDELNQNFFTHASEMLVSLLDSQDIYLAGHSHAVAGLADMVTRRLGLPDDERWTVHFGALLHDIGKLLLGPAILGAEGAIGEEAWDLMRQHPSRGLDLLRPITKWEGLLPIVHGHHERWDGKGYPLGLAADIIPLGARIVAVAEAFDVMTRNTPQGRRRTREEAITELEACAGTQFDPRIVRIFVTEYKEHGDQLRS